MTGLCHESTPAVEEAARWLVSDLRNRVATPIVPHIRKVFGLSTADAIEAIREAQALRSRGGADERGS